MFQEAPLHNEVIFQLVNHFMYFLLSFSLIMYFRDDEEDKTGLQWHAQCLMTNKCQLL